MADWGQIAFVLLQGLLFWGRLFWQPADWLKSRENFQRKLGRKKKMAKVAKFF